MVVSNCAPGSLATAFQRSTASANCGPRGTKGPLFEVRERLIVGRDHARAGAAFDGHVADGHARVHGKLANGFAGVFDDVIGAAADADLADQRQHQILRRNAARALAAKHHVHGLRAALLQALRGQHVLDLAAADAEGQRAERAVRRSVAVAADDGQAGLRDSEFGADDVHDALVAAEQIEQNDAVALAGGFERIELRARVMVQDGQGTVLGGDRVVHHGEGQVGAANLAAVGLETRKSLRRGDLVDQVPVDIDERRLAGGLVDNVGLPNLFVHCFRWHVVSNHPSTAGRACGGRRASRRSPLACGLGWIRRFAGT